MSKVSVSMNTLAPIGMRLNRTWDVRLPPAKKKILGGKLVPTIKGLGGRLVKKKCRLCIEIHGPIKEDDAVPGLQPERPTRGLTRETGSIQTVNLAEQLLDDDRILIKILKPRKHWGFSRDSDSSSSDEEDDDDATQTTASSAKSNTTDYGDWVEYRKYSIDDIVDVELNKREFEATMGLGSNRERREIFFEHDEQVCLMLVALLNWPTLPPMMSAKDFWDQIQELRALVTERAQVRLQAFQASQRKAEESIKNIPQDAKENIASRGAPGVELTPSSEINLLLEIVSATNLPIADRKSTDPYVIVYMGTQELHRTQPISKDVNPIWTVDNGSLFLLSTTAQEFFEASAGLTFIIKDYDGITKNDVLCRTTIDQSALLAMKGERVELPLQILKEQKYKKSSEHFEPKLYLRARPAKGSDRDFMKQVIAVKKSKSLGVYADKTFIGPQKERVGLLKRENKVVDGKRLSRVQPGPDPARPVDTKWLDREALVEEAFKPSTKWIEAGTGKLGKVYLEILKCQGLPNTDTKLDGKTDPFCCAIYEDAIVSTDAINDTLKPCWMPWSQRAFCFRMSHPSSQIHIGVFDFDSAKGINAHDSIGRVSIDVTNVRRDTDYVLTYNLYRSVLDNERKEFGTITVRLRLEYSSFRDLLVGSLQLPPTNHINVPKQAEFRTSFFVVNGEENLERFDMEAIKAYRTELEGYISVVDYITAALATIILWRGHFEVSAGGRFKLFLPVHSAVAFTMGVLLVENPNFLPSFSLFSIAWFLLATNELRQRNPSPWHQTMTYCQLWYAVLADKAPPAIIDSHENEAIIKKYNDEIERRRQLHIKKVEAARKNSEKLSTYLSDEKTSAAEGFDEDDSTKLGGGVQLNPLAIVLLPIQKILGMVCKSLRIASSIVLWNESIYAFIIVNSCLVLGIALIWVPWGFILKWTFRILVWVLLGPWMKLVDIYYMKELEAESTSEIFKKMAEQKLEQVNQIRNAALQRKESVVKSQALKRFMFGKFVTRVHKLKDYRYPDCPLPESYAKPRDHKSAQIVIERRSHGQTLVGDMIPVWGDAVDEVKEKSENKQEEPKPAEQK
eukprot:Nitzschia sp. Nitz4//scaffold348_size17284//6198//9518//NITZ4_008842-RA/size17284-processed-gene-0.10-mRNA-1//-1//CDS//3329548688//5682//frame0